MADNIQAGGSSSTSLVREYRKGNWTLSETMILIEAKKMDDERRMKRSTGSDNTGEGSTVRMSKPAELRWKWVEDYCWRKDCLRSQNQCNDKWDNLMRDYKKVRDYERKLRQTHHDHDQDHAKLSYWRIEKNERKDKNLPTNMLPQIYEALVEVVEKKVAVLSPSVSTTPIGTSHQRLLEITPVATSISTTVNVQQQYQHHQQQQQPLLLPRQHISSSPPIITPLPLPPPVTVTASPSPIQQVHPVIPYPQPILPTMSDSSDSDTSDHSDSPAKRRRKSTDPHRRHRRQEQGTTSASPRNVNVTTAPSSSPPSHDVASAISKSATVIAEALLASEEREERRHRDLMSFHERRLKIEESKAEVNRQGINGLVDAINSLANSIQALASDKHRSSPSSSKPS